MALSLAGCVETTASLPPATSSTAHYDVVRREGVSPSGASVALASVGGGPDALADRFRDLFTEEAKRRDIVLADPTRANYLIRGYVNAYPSDGGTAVGFVWDVFDAQKRRAQRVDDAVVVKATTGDPWSAVDDAALARVAAKSVDDLIAFLTNTPEAIASAAGPRKTAVARVIPPESGETIAPQTAQAVPARAAPRPALGVAALH